MSERTSESARRRRNLFSNSVDGSECVGWLIPLILKFVLFSSPAKKQRPGISPHQGEKLLGENSGPSFGEPSRTGRSRAVMVVTLILLMGS